MLAAAGLAAAGVAVVGIKVAGTVISRGYICFVGQSLRFWFVGVRVHLRANLHLLLKHSRIVVRQLIVALS